MQMVSGDEDLPEHFVLKRSIDDYPLIPLCIRNSPLKTVLYLTVVVGGEQPSRGMPGGAMPSGVKAIG